LRLRPPEFALGTPGFQFIALKNLQNLRICHARMLLAFWACGVLG
jgi:hypothetical protein